MYRLLVCMVAVAALAFADKSPNLSGKWTLNKDLSEFARGAPDSMTAVITDDGTKIHMVQTVNGADNDITVVRGAESVNKLGEMEMRTRLTADGDKLIEDTTFTGPQGTITRKSVMTMSPDGRRITMDSDYESPGRAFHERIVLDKAD